MMPAAKHGDPQMGVDIHLCMVPMPAPTPTPLPTPHMSVVFDPFDYVPYIGATITVCGMKRATAGTSGTVVHIPPGFPFAPKLPEKDDELFMGSSTIVADGDPMSHIAHPVLSCQVAGMGSPFRPKKKGGPRTMVLPTVFNLAIPSTVFLGGPPTISLMGMAFKGAFAALGKFAKSGLFKRMRQKLFGHMKPGFLKCAVLRAEPVNILSGAVSVEQQDFVLPGRLPIEWERGYSSGNRREGVCGPGWETLADARLEIGDDGVLMHCPGVGPLAFAELPAAVGDAAALLELMDGARLSDHGDEYRVRTKADRIYHFAKSLAASGLGGVREFGLSRISDRCGNWLEFERRDGRLVAIDESAGRRLELEVDGARLRQVALWDPATETRHVYVRYEYDAAGDLAAVFDALGNPYCFAYDMHHMVRHTDRNRLSFHYDYDKSGPDGWRVVHSWGDGGLYDYRFEYDDTLNERRITDSLGHVSLVKLDERGLPISEIDPLGGMTVYEYDDAGRTTAVVDPGGRRTGYVYDDSGNLLELKRPDGAALVTEFDEAGKPTAVTDALGHLWRQRFDPRGLLVEQVSPLGNTSLYEYDRSGQLVAFVNPRGARNALSYDAAGRLVRITDALGHCTNFAHDPLGNLAAKGDALDRHTQYRYDVKGRLVAIQLPSGASVQCGYDAEDNVSHYTDENGATTRLEYFGQGEINRRIQPDGHVVDYVYDTEERLVGVRNQRGEVNQLRRDANGRVIDETDYSGQPRRYDYDSSGHLISSQDPLERRIDYERDSLGRIVKKSMADPFGADKPWVETFDYDANGNLVATANAHVQLTREFDAESRLLKEVQAHAAGQSFVIENAYDEAGNRINRTTAGSAGSGGLVSYVYDQLDQAIGVSIDGGLSMSMQRDGAGQITAEELMPGLARSYHYNPDGLMVGQALARDGHALFATRYDYDAAGNMTRRHDSQFGVDCYVYDPMGRVLEHVDPQGQLRHVFTDPTGDRLTTRVMDSTQATAPGPDASATWWRQGNYLGASYRFDRAGNLTHKTDGQSRFDFMWDANQRLISSRRRTDRGPIVTTYGYDPLGRRLFKETAGQRTWFGWDGDVLACVSGGAQSRQFVYRPSSFEAIVMIGCLAGQSRQALIYCLDPNGGAERLIKASGEGEWIRGFDAVFDAHGQERALDNPLRLQGQYFDIETGLHYNRHRYFAPELSQYVSADPLRMSVGENVYALGANTLRWIDPLGMACKAIALGKDIAGGGLKALADQTKSSWWRNWAKDGVTRRTVGNRFGRAFHQAVDRAEHIHFSLDGISHVNNAVKAGAAGFTQHNMTHAELHYLASRPDLWNKMTFYRGGIPVPNPF